MIIELKRRIARLINALDSAMNTDASKNDEAHAFSEGVRMAALARYGGAPLTPCKYETQELSVVRRLHTVEGVAYTFNNGAQCLYGRMTVGQMVAVEKYEQEHVRFD